MKKIIATLLVLMVGASAFADIMIQADGDLFGYDYMSYTTTNSETNEKEHRYVNGPDVFYGIGTSLLWEFNSKSDVKLRPFAGAGIGFNAWGFPITAIGGVNYNLTSFGPFTMELQPSLTAGPLFDIGGHVDLYLQPGVDVILMSKSRRGFYGGLGLTQFTIFEPRSVGLANRFFYGEVGLSCHFLIGCKF